MANTGFFANYTQRATQGSPPNTGPVSLGPNNVQLIAAKKKAGDDPLGGGTPPPPPSTPTKKPKDYTAAGRNAADAPIGIPVTLNPDGSYSSTYIPPMWIAGQGPRARTPDRPFDTNNDPGNDLPNIRSNGQHDWYRGNDVYAPGTLDGSQVQSIQERLVQSGLEDAATVHWGIWSQTDMDAYRVVLGQSNQYGVNASTMLNWLAAHPNTPVVHLANPIDVGAVADSVLPDILGRNLSQGEKQQLTDAWHQIQTQQSSEIPSGPGASQVDAPNLSDFETQWAKQNLGGDYSHHQQTKVLSWINSALGRPV